MKTLIIKEKKELFGLHHFTQRKTENIKGTDSLPLSENAGNTPPEICNSDMKNGLPRATKKQIYHQLQQLKTELEAYITSDAFIEYLSFSYFLNQYIRRQNKLDKQFATDIGVTHAAISQYLNDHRKPTKEFLVRLELHSNNLIPAILWFKLVQKEKEHEIITDAYIRMTENKHVKSKLYFPGKISKLKAGAGTSC